MKEQYTLAAKMFGTADLFMMQNVPEGRDARSELKKRNFFNFSSFFGDFCLKVWFVLQQSNRTKSQS